MVLGRDRGSAAFEQEFLLKSMHVAYHHLCTGTSCRVFIFIIATNKFLIAYCMRFTSSAVLVVQVFLSLTAAAATAALLLLGNFRGSCHHPA
jgi:hypothetical protein